MNTPSPEPSDPQGQVHADFPKTQDTDIVIQSSDGVLFYFHRRNLEFHTEAFPGAEFAAPDDEVTHLSETGEVLAILFGFMYKRKHPNLENMPYSVVGPVAEAVEKYRLYAAMYACEVRLRNLVQEYPVQIVLHGLKHDYPDLVDRALPYMARKGLVEVAKLLPVEYLLPWCQYKEAWDNAFTAVLERTGELQNAAVRDPESPPRFKPTGHFGWNSLETCSPPRPASPFPELPSEPTQPTHTQTECKHLVTKVLEWKAKADVPSLRSALSMSAFSSGPTAILKELCKEQINLIPPFTSFLRGDVQPSAS